VPSLVQKLAGLLTDFPDTAALAVIREDGAVDAVPRPPAAGASAAVDGLLRAGDEAAAGRGEGPVQQVLVDTPDGAVFAVREAGCHLVAVTRPHPRSIGLLLYELRTLRDDGTEASRR